jgi:hypothetical protein
LDCELEEGEEAEVEEKKQIGRIRRGREEGEIIKNSGKNTRMMMIIIIIIIIIINVRELQKTAILGTAHILRKVLM